MDAPTKILILGGGAAGTLIAMRLASQIRKLNLSITLIDYKVCTYSHSLTTL